MRRYYRALVYQPNDTTVDFTLNHDEFTAWPDRFGGQRVNLLEAKVESLPFSFNVRAAGFQDKITQSGSPVALQRRIQFQRNVNPTTFGWVDIGGGRIQQIEQAEDLSYKITAQDERHIERNTVIFAEADTCAIWPPAPVIDLENFLEVGGRLQVEVTAATTDGHRDLPFDINDLPSRIQDVIADDLRPGDDERLLGADESRYRNLTLRLYARANQAASTSAFGDYRIREFDEGPIFQDRVVILDPNATLSASTARYHAFIYAPKRPPSDDLPLHVPSNVVLRRIDPRFFDANENIDKGMHPFQLVKDIYDGSYQQTVVAGTTRTVSSRTVRYSTATLSQYTTSHKEGLIENPKYPLVRYRITESEVMADFLQRGIFAPFNVLPVIAPDGSIKLTDFDLPSAETVSTTGLFQFTASNMTQPPSWSHSARDQLTALRARYPRYVYGYQEVAAGAAGAIAVPESAAGLDGIKPETHEEEFRHARLDSGELLRREVLRTWPGTDAEAAGHNTADVNAAELFERYGDGPQESRLAATTAASTVTPGDLVLVNVTGFPNTANSTRGDAVMMQVMSKIPRADGYSFDAQHVGVNLQPLPAPTVDLQQSGSDPRHTLRFSISGFASTNDTAIYQLADSTATPGTTDWFNVGTNKAARFLDVGDLKSGTKYWGRARVIRAGRVGSVWSVPDSTSTQALAPPTALQSTYQGGTYIDLSWQNGEDDQWTDILDPVDYLDHIGRGGSRFRVIGLTPNTTYAYAVRHRDKFGGVSAPTTKLSVSTSTNVNDNLPLDPPLGFGITIGLESLVDTVTSSTT